MTKINLIQINRRWVEEELISHLTEKIGNKVNMRVYTIMPSSTQMDYLSLSNFLSKIIPHYVYSIKEIEKDILRQQKRNEAAIRKANPSALQARISQNKDSHEDAKNLYLADLLRSQIIELGLIPTDQSQRGFSPSGKQPGN